MLGLASWHKAPRRFLRIEKEGNTRRGDQERQDHRQNCRRRLQSKTKGAATGTAQALGFFSWTVSSCKLQLVPDGRRASCLSGEGPAHGLCCLTLHRPKCLFPRQTCLQPVQQPHALISAFRSLRFTSDTESKYDTMSI